LGLGNLECKLQVSKNEDPMSWKSCPKNFQVWVLETHTVYVPKLKSHVLKIMSLKISCLGFGEPPQCKQTPGGQKLRQLRTPQGVAKNWDS
jgi:hypothetical protein